MALVALKCSECEHTYDAFTGSTIKDEDADRCPKCGGTNLARQVATSVGSGPSEIDLSKMDAGELQLHYENKAWMEANSDKFLSGEWGHRVPKTCPKELRPQLPEHMRKRYY